MTNLIIRRPSISHHKIKMVKWLGHWSCDLMVAN